MDGRGGGVRAENCYSVGFEPERSSPSTPTQPSQGGGVYRQPQYPQPQQPSVDLEQQRREDEERRQREEEAERARQTEIERQRQEKLRQDREDAVNRLRGGVDKPFGIRGNAPGDLQIRQLPAQSRGPDPDQTIPPVWRQLYCAHNILRGVLTNAKEGNLDEMHYLAQEMKNALDSLQLGVECGEIKPPPPPYGQKELPGAKMLIFYKKLLDATTREGEKVQGANRDIERAQADVKRARERLQTAQNPPTKTEIRLPPQESPPVKQKDQAKDDPIAIAYEQQKAYQEKENRRIEEVYKEQKEKQSSMDEAMALLRESQRQLNEVNSRKTEATNTLNQYLDMSIQLVVNPGLVGELEQKITQRTQGGNRVR
jgi:hypothetical protein